jgi:hypothetical protein
LTTGAEARLVQLSQAATAGKGFRTNVGLASISEVPITVTLDIFNREGNHLDTIAIDLQPFELRQESGLLKKLVDGDLDDAYIKVHSDTPEARHFAYASVIDNRTNDSVFRDAR